MINRSFFLALVPVFTLFAAACGDDSSGLVCGAGTVAMGGMCVPECGPGTDYDPTTMTCVPDDTGPMCAPGTVRMGDECVPDGTVICTTGTTYDPATGTCVPDISNCGPGTILMDGMCVPTERPIGENTEGAEPNDAAIEDVTPPEVLLPGVGDMTDFSGCIVPADTNDDGTLDPDFDSWTFTATGPTIINVRVDGFEGLAGGFVVRSEDEVLVTDGWSRFGIGLTATYAERRVLIPGAGTYDISFTDSRSVLTGLPAGSDTACYYATLAVEALPAATPLVGGMATGTDFGDPQFYSFTATEGQLLFPTLAEESESVLASIVQIVDGAYAGSARADFADSPDVGSLLLDLDAGAEVFLVVDHVYDISLDQVGWTLDSGDAGAQLLTPGDNTFTHRDGLREWRYFDATDGDVVNIEFDGGGTDVFDMIVASPTRVIVSQPCDGFFPCADADEWIPITAGGRHYIGLYNYDGVVDADYTVTFGTTAVTPTDLTRGTAGSADLTATGQDRDFFRVNVSDMDWLTFDIGAPVNVTDVLVKLYPDGESGALDLELLAQDTDTATTLGGFGRIFEEDTTLLVSVEDDDGHDGDETFDLTVADRVYTDLGTVTEAAAIVPMAATLAADETLYYMVRAEPGSQVTVTATPTGSEDLVLARLDRTESVEDSVDVGFDGDPEMLVHQLIGGYMPFTLTEYAGAAGGADVGVTSLDPPYRATAGTTPFVDICMAGAVHALTADGFLPADDDGLSTTPFTLSALTFNYFGMAVSEITVSSNGWMSFQDTAVDSRYFPPSSFPEMGFEDDPPDAIIAPYWRDLTSIEVCTFEEAARAVVQWTGETYSTGAPVQFQVVLHADGRIELIYGPEHFAPTGALIGMENQDASFGLNWVEPVLFETSVLISPT